MAFLWYLDIHQFDAVWKSGSNHEAHTSAEMADQMLSTLEAPGAMTARVVEPVH